MPEALVGAVIATFTLPLVMAGLAVAYVGLRLRDAKAEQPDPELGIKSAYQSFLSFGVLLALAGLSIAVGDLLAGAFEDPNNKPQQQFNRNAGKMNQQFPLNQPMAPPAAGNEPFDTMNQRVAWPLVVSGVLAAFVSLLLLKLGTNDARYPSVRRTFGGFRLAVAGLNLVVIVTVVIEILFDRDETKTRPLPMAAGMLLVWGLGAVFQLFILKRESKLAYYVPPKPKKKVQEDYEDDDRDDDEPRRSSPRGRRTEDDERRERRPPEPRKEREERGPPPRRRPRDEDDK
jgi:hypothetical protein